MALIDISLRPTRPQLRWFGLVILMFFTIVGGVVYMGLEAHALALVLWASGLILTVIYYVISPVRLVIYRGWMYAFMPIGWSVSYTVLALIYFVLITPTGLVMRVLGRDALLLRPGRSRATYWREREENPEPTRYFRQF